MIPTLVIGLREGLEASLIVGIIASFLARAGRPDALRATWIGVGIATVLCIAIGVALVTLSRELPQQSQEALETVIGAFAVVMVTAMILWMTKHARFMKKELEGAAAQALARGSATALIVMAFLAVLREGFETSVFLVSVLNASNSVSAASAGAVLGIVIAIGIGYGIYKGGVKLNLARFFKITGLVLVLVAAGLAMTVIHTAHEAGWITFGQGEALNLSWLVQPGTVASSLITGVLGIQPKPTVIEAAVWLLYAVPMIAYLSWPRGPRRSRPVAVRAAPADAASSAGISSGPAAPGSAAASPQAKAA